jgi:hypothetical protein
LERSTLADDCTPTSTCCIHTTQPRAYKGSRHTSLTGACGARASFNLLNQKLEKLCPKSSASTRLWSDHHPSGFFPKTFEQGVGLLVRRTWWQIRALSTAMDRIQVSDGDGMRIFRQHVDVQNFNLQIRKQTRKQGRTQHCLSRSHIVGHHFTHPREQKQISRSEPTIFQIYHIFLFMFECRVLIRQSGRKVLSVTRRCPCTKAPTAHRHPSQARAEGSQRNSTCVCVCVCVRVCVRVCVCACVCACVCVCVCV